MKCKNCGSEVSEVHALGGNCPHCGEILKYRYKAEDNHSDFLSQLKAKQNDQVIHNSAQKNCEYTNWLQQTFNFDNIGNKIKTLAKWSCWIGIVLTWCISAFMFIHCLLNSDIRNLWWIWPISAITIPFVIWIGSWYTYIIGNLIENNEKRTESQIIIANAISKDANNLE